MLRCVFSLSVMPILSLPSVCNLPFKRVAVVQEVTSSRCKTAVLDFWGDTSLQGLERHTISDVD